MSAPVDVRVVEDPSGFSAEMVLDEADNWTARHTGAEMLRNYAALLDGQPAGVCPNCDGSGAEVRTVASCCGHAMSNGDCCGNPEPEEVADPCNQCGGSGQAAIARVGGAK